jgi:hypothetical protein
MSWRRIFMSYGWAIALREWQRCKRIQPEVRLATTAFAGAVLAPVVVFLWPIGRLYWLITGRRLPRPLGMLAPPPRIVVKPFPMNSPPEIRELLKRPEYQWKPEPGDFPRWLRVWGYVAQALQWERPRDIASFKGR